MEQARLIRFLRRDEVERFCGLKRTAIREMVANGEFPQPVKLNDSGRAVAWLESELEDWQRERLARARVNLG